MFLHAQVPGATTIREVLDAWEKRGLKAVEVTEVQFVQTIHITHNLAGGRFTWKGDNIDGNQALGLTADVMRDMFRYFVGNPGRPKLHSGKAKVAVMMDGQNIALPFDRKENPTVVKGLLMAALWKLIEETASGNYDPLEEFAGILKFEVKE